MVADVRIYRLAKDRAALAVIIVAALATVATSKPREVRQVVATLELSGPDSEVARVALTAEAVAEADWLVITFDADGGAGALDSLSVVPGPDGLEAADLAVESPRRYGFEPADHCAADAACELSFEVSAQGEGAAEVAIRAELERDGGEFSDGARIDILVP